MSAQIYQVGPHFAALIEGVLMAPLKTIERVFLAFHVLLPDCVLFSAKILVYMVELEPHLPPHHQSPPPEFKSIDVKDEIPSIDRGTVDDFCGSFADGRCRLLHG